MMGTSFPFPLRVNSAMLMARFDSMVLDWSKRYKAQASGCKVQSSSLKLRPRRWLGPSDGLESGSEAGGI
jgi:hypothetical protein